MARQPLTGRRARPGAALPALVLAGCINNEPGRRAFDGPEATAFLPAEQGPFDGPVLFVANSRSGTIVPVDVKHLSLLADTEGAPWLDPHFVATGDQRQLGALAAWSPDGQAVRLFAADLAYDVLVEAPYVEGVAEDGSLELFEVSATDPVFEDNDGSGDEATLTLELQAGATTTEDWLVDYDGERWWVTGTRSGKQGTTATIGEEFVSDNHEIRFTIEGTATAGDRFRFSTDSGLVEHDLGGTPLGLAPLPDTGLLLVGVWDAEAGQGEVVAWDMAAGAEAGRVALPDGAQPYAIVTGQPPEGDEPWPVFVGDARNPAVYALNIDPAAPDAASVDTIAAAAPVAALAWVGDDGLEAFDRPAYSHLFVAPAGLNRVDVYDLDAGSWIDVNPLDDVVGGIELPSPVVGLSPSRRRVRLQQQTNFGARLDDQVVGVTTFDGSFLMFEGSTGCLATDSGGPAVSSTSSGVEQFDFTDRGDSSNPEFYVDAATGRAITPSGCGGVVRSEAWTLTYDEVEGNWIVEGAISGEQEARAYEDERYTSDDGAISFIILSGTEATTDGDTYTFAMDDGVLRVDSVATGRTATPAALELPAPPLVVEYDAGPTGGGWDEDPTHHMALVPVTNSDILLRVRLDTFQVEAIWD